MAVLIGMTGLFDTEGQTSAVPDGRGIIFLLHIPHLPIFLHQLSKGGLGAGSARSLAFPLQYFHVSFQWSPLLIPFLLIWFLRKKWRVRAIPVALS